MVAALECDRTQGAESHAAEIATLKRRMEEDEGLLVKLEDELADLRGELNSEKKSSTEARKKVSVLERNWEKETEGHAS